MDRLMTNAPRTPHSVTATTGQWPFAYWSGSVIKMNLLMNKHAVLVIDDDPDIRDVIAQTLVDEGYDIVTCADGQAALDLLATWKPDVILLDLMMPIMSGWEVLEQLKTIKTLGRISVVLLSASRELETTAKQSGVAGYLAKPFDLERLIATIEHHIK